MDTAFDFAILFKLSEKLEFDCLDYVQNEWTEIWQTLDPHQTKMVDGKMFYRTPKELFCETKKVVPLTKMAKVLQWCHDANVHPGPERTILLILQLFFSNLTKKAIHEIAKKDL